MKKNAVKILQEAEERGWEAYEKVVPTPMVVQQRENSFDDNSPVEKEWFVSDGVCGFAWINVKGNSWFIRQLKKAGFASPDINCFDRKVVFHKKTYGSGYSYWVGGGQSLTRKEAFARAFTQVLRDNGIDCNMGSRLD